METGVKGHDLLWRVCCTLQQSGLLSPFTLPAGKEITIHHRMSG